MDSYGLYGETIGPIYDRLYGPAEQSQVAFLAQLANGRDVLELGVGTGRVALPLVGRGVSVAGVDVSPTMLELLAAKAEGANLPTYRQNFAELELERTFGMIFIVFSTLYALLTQPEQCECLRRVRRHLEPGGHFCVEGFVPKPTLFTRGQRVSARALTEQGVLLDAAVHRLNEQRVSSRLALMDEGGITVYPAELRYLWPSELDLMARLAGMGLVERWGGWLNEPATSQSARLVSVYQAK